jgi:hypothetical protein
MSVTPPPSTIEESTNLSIDTRPRPTSSVEKLKSLSLASFTNQVKVIIGEEKSEISIPLHIITHHSDFFKAACKEYWKSGRTKTVILDEEEPETFAVFLTWIYTGSIKNSVDFVEPLELDIIGIREEDWALSENEGKRAPFQLILEDQWFKLAKCFVLSEFLQAPNFQNAVTDMLVSNHRRMSSMGLMAGSRAWETRYVLTNTLDGNALRTILLDNYLKVMLTSPHVLKGDEFRTTLLDNYLNTMLNSPSPTEPDPEHPYPCFQECLQELALHANSILPNGLQRKNYAQLPWHGEVCRFHVHPGRSEGYSCSY